MKPSVAALICPEANTSMPALIAESKSAEKRANMEYAAHNSNFQKIADHVQRTGDFGVTFGLEDFVVIRSSKSDRAQGPKDLGQFFLLLDIGS
ncbi:hypothetical protein DSO57_1018401 [Entomophthora muscae]|uniref:Uncharacterized protein n=1 Tax=Entomophthora muscae TaxID=34485 RepID=A0ACC2U2E1_9FUNG|nr:hypothetical protein DSO57_1018401 [Entomophthora muscae]